MYNGNSWPKFFLKKIVNFFFSKGPPFAWKTKNLVISLSVVQILSNYHHILSWVTILHWFEVYEVSFESRSLLTSNLHLGKMDIFPFSPIMWSQCAYLATCIVCKTILFEYTMVTEDDLSHWEVHHLQNRPICAKAPFSPANGPCSTSTPTLKMKTYNIFLSTMVSHAQNWKVYYKIFEFPK